MSSVEYNSNFSKPGALESLDKDYETFSKKINSKINAHIDYKSIRTSQKLTGNDTTLMTDF